MNKVEIITGYKTTDGKLFTTSEEATRHQEMINASETERQNAITAHNQILEKIATLKRSLTELYEKVGFDVNRCYYDCMTFDTRDRCLKHLCTCHYGHCDRHTNIHFKNTGCYWCGYTDCSKYGC